MDYHPAPDAATPTGKMFCMHWEARFGNMPELGAVILKEFAEQTDPEIWRLLLDRLVADGYSQKKKPMLPELERSAAAVIRERLAVAKSRRPIRRPSNAATAAEVGIICRAAALGGPRLSAWLVTGDSDATRTTPADTWPLSVLTNAEPAALELVAAAHKVNDAWAKWATGEIAAGHPLEALAEQIAAAPTPAAAAAPAELGATVAAVAVALSTSEPDARPVDALREVAQ